MIHYAFILGEAFGVGVYEEDDFDVYNNARDDMAQYDFSLDVGKIFIWPRLTFL